VHMGYNYFQFWKLEQAVTAFAQSPEPGEFMLTLRQHFDGWFNVEKATELYEAWRANPGSPELASNAVSGLQEVYNARVKMEADIPTVGASGSVFGLLLAFGMLFPNTELMLLFFPVPIKAKYFVILYAALELYLGIQNNPGDNIAHFAHLGGALFGFVLVKLWSRDRRNFY
jgi:membrane associated rhomboid family serine protease